MSVIFFFNKKNGAKYTRQISNLILLNICCSQCYLMRIRFEIENEHSHLDLIHTQKRFNFPSKDKIQEIVFHQF